MSNPFRLSRHERAAAHRLMTRGANLHSLSVLAEAPGMPDAFRREARKCASRLRAVEAIAGNAPADVQRRALEEVAALHPPEPDQTFAAYDAAWERVAVGATRDDLCRVLDDPRLSPTLRDIVSRAILGMPLDGAE